MKRYTTFVDIGTVTLTVLPRDVLIEQAQAQEAAVCAFMAQFPGGTQAIKVWSELTA